MERSTHIEVPGTNNSRAASSIGTSQPPRIQHYDGEIPPVLSPLDAFAAESRRLAKELEATRIAGERRMSRLPPAVITKTLTQHTANRPACFRSLSGAADPPPVPHHDAFTAANSPELTEPSQRPKSSYPRISAVLKDDQEEDIPYAQESDFSQQFPVLHEIQRTQSPSSISERPQRFNIDRTASDRSQSKMPAGLVPPNAPFAKPKQYHESSDDEYPSSNAGSTFSQPIPRKSSNSSGTSFPASPFPYHERSPSAKSNDSMSSLKKLQLNFSRPLSQSSLHIDSPSMEQRPLARNRTQLSDPSRYPSEDYRFPRPEGYVTGQSNSYTHKRFVLPRGKLSKKASTRVSQLFSGLSTPAFYWQEPMFPGTPPLSARTDSSSQNRSPTSRLSFEPESSVEATPHDSPAIDSSFVFQHDFTPVLGAPERPSSAGKVSDHFRPAAASPQRPSTSHGSTHNFHSFDRPFIPALPPIPGSTNDDLSLRSSHKTEQSQSTIRPTTARTYSDYQALSADEHVDKAITLHQSGDLKASTYHLRIAAKQEHPTGMLLFALACRQGWGMRANPTEGVALLRRAVDAAMQEVAEDEDESNQRDASNKRSHRAQFALGIYELGICHLNGMGVEQDKALALRCFEIAGDWGDADALTEAGFCYAEGIGCKKNLKKAAKFYRRAEAKGVSMIGNSWIYKSKYDDEEVTDEARSRKPAVAAVDDKTFTVTTKNNRSKSKTRSFFGRKRSPTITKDKDKDKESALAATDAR